MKKLILRYILYSQLIIQSLSLESQVKYEITNKEAATNSTNTDIVIVLEELNNQTSNFTNPNNQAETFIGNKNLPTYPEEQNGLDAVFTEPVKLTIKTEKHDEDTNTTAAVSDNKSVKYMNVEKNDSKYINQDSFPKESINKTIKLRSDHDQNHLGKKISINALEFFGSSYIKPIRINTHEVTNGTQEEGKTNKTIKHILQWTTNNSFPFTGITGAGQKAFIDRNCSYTNCVVVKRNSSIGNYQNFDAIVFFGKDLKLNRKSHKELRKLTRKRRPHQKYVFTDLDHDTIPDRKRYNDFFNWTFTYKLNSDLVWSPFIVKDIKGSVVAPSLNPTWLKREKMLPVSENVMNVLLEKNIGVVWFYPCNLMPTKNICFIRRFLRILKSRYGVHVDQISKCWYEIDANKDLKALLSKVVKEDYHFYIVLQDTDRDDYVTNEILDAYHNFAVPIMVGEANFSRFLPDDSYLDAKEHTVFTLARQVYKLVRDFDLYVEYFKWTNHYSFHRPEESPDTDHICRMCELMNNETKLNETTVYGNITKWWNEDDAYNSISEYVSPVSEETSISFDIPIERSRPKISFLRRTAHAYTSFIDSIIGGVKNIFGALIG